jgi:hypothetical protein
MVPRLTEMVTGATGEMFAPPNAGDSLTAATGGGTTVVDGELGALLDDALAAGPAVAGAPAWLTPPVVWTAANPEDEPEQAAVAARTPPTSTAMAARRAFLER